MQLEEEPEPHLKIQGMADSRKAAKAMVRDLLAREEEELFPVAAKYHGLLVGKRGMTVKELQRDSGAFISFVKKPEPGMLVKGLTENRDRAWALTSHVVGQLPLVLAEMRGVDADTAQKELDDTFDFNGRPAALAAAAAAEAGDEGGDGAQGREIENPRADEIWEEAVARALERAKNLYREQRAEAIRRERGAA